MSIQTILGANGVIGRELSRHLSAYTDRTRQVSRTPRRLHATDELVSADLLDAKATADAVAGISVAYLVAGLKLHHRVFAGLFLTRDVPSMVAGAGLRIERVELEYLSRFPKSWSHCCWGIATGV
jgi:uncharacterized protein YbjT (DUF2867 family)